MRVDSSPDNAGTGQHCQMAWVRQARRKGVTKVNQRLNASQDETTSSNLAHLGWVATRTRTMMSCRETLGSGDVADREATVNACGVTVAKLQGHSWAPTPSNGSRMNVGTTLMVLSPASSQLVGGKTHRQSMLSGWG